MVLWMASVLAATLSAGPPTHVHGYGVERVVGTLQTLSGPRMVARSHEADDVIVWLLSSDLDTMLFQSPENYGDPVDFYDFDGDGWEEAVFVEEGRTVHVIDVRSFNIVRRVVLQTTTDTGDAGVEDFDGDGVPELYGILCGRGSTRRFCVRSLTGAVLWQSSLNRPEPFAAVQADGTPELELLVSGQIHDPITGAVLATPLPTTSKGYRAIDVDGDGLDDVVYEDADEHVLQDIRTGVVSWRVPYGQLGPVVPPTAVDVDDDGDVELVWGSPAHVLDVDGVDITPPEIAGCVDVTAGLAGASGWIACNDDGLLVDLDGRTRDVSGLGPARRVFSVDLDGDGAREVLVLGDAVARVFDRRGWELTRNHDLSASVVSVLTFPNGHEVVVRTARQVGLVRLQWRADRGFFDGVTLLSTNQDLDDPALVDADGDGAVDLVYRTSTGWNAFQLATGADLGEVVASPTALFVEHIGEFDGQPGADLLYRTFTGGYQLRAGGQDRPVSGDPVTVARLGGTSAFLSRSGSTVALYDPRSSLTTPLGSLSIQGGSQPAFWLDGRVYYSDGPRIRADDPRGGDSWQFDVDTMQLPPVRTRDAVWFATRQAVERYALP